MTVRLTRRCGALPRAVLLAVIVALVPLPVLAGEPSHAAKGQPLQASIARAAAREALLASPSRVGAAREGQQGAPVDRSALDHSSFFKTKAGAVALAIVAAGTAYALYSTSHDRIHSTVRK